MNNKEKIAYVIGSLIVLYSAFAGRDFSNTSEVLEGILMVAMFLRYMNKRSIPDFEPYKIGE